MSAELSLPRDLLVGIKDLVGKAQIRAVASVITEIIVMYRKVGKRIAARQKDEGWGACVITRLAAELNNELPEHQGFLVRNIQRMVQFEREYPGLLANAAPAVPHSENESKELSNLLKIIWGRNIVIIQKIKDLRERLGFVRQSFTEGWGRDVRVQQIKSSLHTRLGSAVTNFTSTLRDINKPIGVADYELTRALPENLASSLPSIETIEAELSQDLEDQS